MSCEKSDAGNWIKLDSRKLHLEGSGIITSAYATQIRTKVSNAYLGGSKITLTLKRKNDTHTFHLPREMVRFTNYKTGESQATPSYTTTQWLREDAIPIIEDAIKTLERNARTPLTAIAKKAMQDPVKFGHWRHSR
jgi:hypothetical protein